MKKYIVILSLIVSYVDLFSQITKIDYFSFIDSAKICWKKDDYNKAIIYYSKALNQCNNSKLDGINDAIYYLACSYALTNNNDEAFYFLFKYLKNIDSDFPMWDNSILNSAYLKTLMSDKRWKSICDSVASKSIELNANLNGTLTNIFDEIRKEKDKKLHITNKNNDSIRLARILNMIDSYGWPSYREIGHWNNQLLLEIIICSDTLILQKYLPIMRNAFNKGIMRGRDLALIEDRYSISISNMQIYGTNIFKDNLTGEEFLFPLIDPDNLDNRRVKLNLMPIKYELKQMDFNINWDIDYYKNNLLRYKKLCKKNN